MSTTTSIAADYEALSKALAEHKPLDPEVRRRIDERAKQIKLPTFDEEISVKLIREARDA